MPTDPTLESLIAGGHYAVAADRYEEQTGDSELAALITKTPAGEASPLPPVGVQPAASGSVPAATPPPRPCCSSTPGGSTAIALGPMTTHFSRPRGSVVCTDGA